MSLYDTAEHVETGARTAQQLTEGARVHEAEVTAIAELIQEHLELAGVPGKVRETVGALLSAHRQHAYRAGYARCLATSVEVTE